MAVVKGLLSLFFRQLFLLHQRAKDIFGIAGAFPVTLVSNAIAKTMHIVRLLKRPSPLLTTLAHSEHIST